jgi:hypothetical protein
MAKNVDGVIEKVVQNASNCYVNYLCEGQHLSSIKPTRRRGQHYNLLFSTPQRPQGRAVGLIGGLENYYLPTLNNGTYVEQKIQK